jgi:hypothetical protein
MANNALIQGAKETGKQFLDVGKAVAQGFATSSAASGSGSALQVDSRIAKNKAIQNKVNSYMGNLKTDMDFTSFSPEETKTMRNFLMTQRSEYANAAKEAAKFDDTTSPEYMEYVDIMQGVNNSFKNMASQLGAYKKGKVEYAENQLDGMYSNGNGDANSNAARIYGFADEDGDGMADIGVNAPFKILAGGNVGFDLDGQEVSYNNMEQPFLKDSKLALGILKDNETIYNKGTQGGEINPEMLKSYEAKLTSDLQNEDALKSVLYDFESELNTADIAKRVTDNVISLDDARKEVVSRLVNARKSVFGEGKKQYDIKNNKLTPYQTHVLKVANDKITLLESGKVASSTGSGTKRYVTLKDDKSAAGKQYYETDMFGNLNLNSKPLTSKDEIIEVLGINVKGLNWK